MEIIHTRGFIILPCRAAKAGTPVIGWSINVLSFPPDVVIPVRVFLGAFTFDKPFVLVGGVVYNKIHNDAQPSFVGFDKKLVKVLHGSEFIHDCLIITDIIAIIIIRRFVYRGEPDDIDP